MTMAEKLYAEIKQVESEADKILSDSETQSAVIIKEANTESLNILSKGETELKDIRSTILDKARSDAAALKDKQLQKSKTIVSNLEKSANKKREAAKKLILDRFSRLASE